MKIKYCTYVHWHDLDDLCVTFSIVQYQRSCWFRFPVWCYLPHTLHTSLLHIFDYTKHGVKTSLLTFTSTQTFKLVMFSNTSFIFFQKTCAYSWAFS